MNSSTMSAFSSSSTKLIKKFNFDSLLVPNTWVWCLVPEKTDGYKTQPQEQWRLGRIACCSTTESNVIPGSVLCDILVPKEKTQVTTETPTSSSLRKKSKSDDDGNGSNIVPRRMVISRSSIFPYASLTQSALSVPPLLLDDLSFLLSSQPLAFASLLCDRLSRDVVYTAVGPRVLISMNPFKELSNSSDFVTEYGDQSASSLPTPHPLMIARRTYDRMNLSARSQSIVLIGPSGGGRAYTATRIVQYLASCHREDEKRTNERQIRDKERILTSRVHAVTSIILPFTQVRPFISSNLVPYILTL